MLVRLLRALWPVVFLVPMSWWADRGCKIVGVDPLYHGIVWIHERLGWFLALFALVSAAVVAAKIILAQRRLRHLLALSEPLPPAVQAAFHHAALELGIRMPVVAYLDIAETISTTVYGPIILLSRGFVEPLDGAELRLVARHELAHATHQDARTGALLHLAFAALLIPGFEPLERRLHARRERRANLLAARGDESKYVALLLRLARRTICADANLGLEAPARRPDDVWLTWVAPMAVGSLAIALLLSHLAFRHDLPYLLTHHC